MIYSIDRLEQLYKAISEVATKLMPDRSDELAQDVVVKLWSKRGRLPACFSAGYLRSVVKNAARDIMRKDKKLKRSSYFSVNEDGSISCVGEPTKLYLIQGGVDPVSESEKILEECYAAIDRMARIHAALDTLPAEQRSAITLYVKGRTYAQIAEIEGVPEGTVRSRIHYARKKMRKYKNESN